METVCAFEFPKVQPSNSVKPKLRGTP